MNHGSVWEQLTRLAFLPQYGKLMTGAMELDVFSHLSRPMTPEALAKKMGWNGPNTGYLLGALTSVGFLEQVGEGFRNLPDTDRYLVRGKPEYLGGFLLYYAKVLQMVPLDVKKLVMEGPQSDGAAGPRPGLPVDYAQLGSRMSRAQEGYRQQEILRLVRALPENGQLHRVLDVGCATGLLGLSVISDGPGRTGTLFDQLPAELMEESIRRAGLEGRVEARSGNFLTDELGGGYDLILGVSMMLFAKERLELLLRKLCSALNPGGVLLLVSEGIEPDFTGPWDMVLGYLPYSMQGIPFAVERGEIARCAHAAGFTGIETRSEQLCTGMQDVIILRK